MQEVFEKIITSLEAEVFKSRGNLTRTYAFEKAIEIVKQKAAEYNDGWIPCSERLPERYFHCLVTRRNEYEDGFDTDVREDTYVEIECIWDWQSKHEGLMDEIIAWQPLPEPYQPK